MSKLHAFCRYWLPLLAWMTFIFIGSTDLLSAPHTSRFLVPFLHWLKPDLSDDTVWTIQLIIRKCGHLTEYAFLGLLWWRALRQPVVKDTRPWDTRVARWAVIMAGLYAATDEFHQTFVSSRQGSPWDVLIDTMGAALGITALWAFGRWRKFW